MTTTGDADIGRTLGYLEGRMDEQTALLQQIVSQIGRKFPSQILCQASFDPDPYPPISMPSASKVSWCSCANKMANWYAVTKGRSIGFQG